jgi:PncC family amidohydrolase
MIVHAHELGRLLKARGLTLAVAESCTGGKLGDMITEVSGSSHYFMGGVICYSNMAKVDLLSVEKGTLDSRGAVSEEVALQMAAGARKALRASIGVGITGIAGPSGGTMEKPVGLVYIAICSDHGSACTRNLFDGDRSAVKNSAAKRALEMLEEFVSKEP